MTLTAIVNGAVDEVRRKNQSERRSKDEAAVNQRAADRALRHHVAPLVQAFKILERHKIVDRITVQSCHDYWGQWVERHREISIIQSPKRGDSYPPHAIFHAAVRPRFPHDEAACMDGEHKNVGSPENFIENFLARQARFYAGNSKKLAALRSAAQQIDRLCHFD